MSRLLALSLAAALCCVLLASSPLSVSAKTRAFRPVHGTTKPVDMAALRRLLPTKTSKPSPLPHDLFAPNGGAPWQGGNVFKAGGARPIPKHAQADGPIAETQYGSVQGYLDDGVNIWRGIPYASPPTGEFRLREPQDALNWTGVRETISEAPICPQIHIFDWLYGGNEDCLYLDVYSPTDAGVDGVLKPVFVWIYGGAWIFGDNYEFGLYDGHNVAKARDHVIVAMNYRLGPLGFMSNDAIRDDNGQGLAGNFGLLDQIKALEWVQANIRNFGGDPSRVTIGGESAGAFSTCFHLASPLSTGLFHAAILESGTCNDQNFFVEYPLQRNWTNTYVTMVGCDPDASGKQVLECLRALPTGAIMGNLLGTPTKNVTENMQSLRNAHADARASKPHWGYHPHLFPAMSWGATIDHVALLRQPLRQIDTGDYNDVPVLMGSNNDEGTMFVPMMFLIVPGTHFPVQAADMPLAMEHFFGTNTTIISDIMNTYPLENYKSPEDCFADILRDFMFVCSSRRALASMTTNGNSSAWLYHWDYQGDWIEDPLLGDYHSSELEFVWDNQFPPLIHIFSENDQTMANTIDTYWSNFVWAHSPNGNSTRSRTGELGDEEYWAAFNTQTQQDMVLALPTRVESKLWSPECDMWDSIENKAGIIP